MTSVFIVRPFNVKKISIETRDGTVDTASVDFEKIEADLIKPALEKAGLEGRTTQDIAEAGNIRVDMFQRLVAYDLVIADISIDNANVFYELGIRHGLRPNGTILIRFATPGKPFTFDLQTDRYLPYDRDKPQDSVDKLATAIRATIDATQRANSKPDSPVFLLLPELKAPDAGVLLAVPLEFREAVEKAESDAVNGPATLALLAEEAKRNAWAREGVRLVAAAQRGIKAFEASRESLEFIRNSRPDDVEANLQLATIYQRRGDLVSASQACQRVLDNESAPRNRRADARSQLARNTKAVWMEDIDVAATEEVRRQKALADSRLVEAFEGYMAGFAEDLNDYYSGINALGLLTAIVELAGLESQTWVDLFKTPRKASNELEDYQEQLTQLRGTVRMALDNAQQRAQQARKPDVWLPASNAQYELLTAGSDNPAYMRGVYQKARQEGRQAFSVESEARQVGLFLNLGLFVANCTAALEALGVKSEDLRKNREGVGQVAKRNLTLVGTGHRADSATRKSPRFPDTADSIKKVKGWLRETIEAEKALTDGDISGIGGAASGTDLLFHEVCEELGIPTTVVLPIPAPDYCRESVANGDPAWVDKFHARLRKSPMIVLSESDELPIWAKEIPKYSVFQRGNIWMLEKALLRPNAEVTVVALWNGQAGDGPGGTADMIKLAEEHGAKICRADSNQLFDLPKPPP